jgi:hypothetical protein
LVRFDWASPRHDQFLGVVATPSTKITGGGQNGLPFTPWVPVLPLLPLVAAVLPALNTSCARGPDTVKSARTTAKIAHRTTGTAHKTILFPFTFVQHWPDGSVL